MPYAKVAMLTNVIKYLKIENIGKWNVIGFSFNIVDFRSIYMLP